MAKKDDSNVQNNSYPPVVAVLGHVDHGKTSLLDAIRKTSIAEREHGGITQSIGASKVTIDHEGKNRDITFLDTPGHEAFSQMRSRGATVADIGLLIVSSADGLMPQTKESIALLKNASIPFIVVLTKSDLETKNPEKVKQQLLKEEVMIEGYGGDIPIIEVSSRTGTNIHELLDLILLVFDMKTGEKPSRDAVLKAVVIESRLDPKAGAKVSIVIKSGTLAVRDEVFSDDVSGRVRSIMDSKRAMLKSASVGEAVEVLGFESVPAVGSVITKKSETVEAVKPEVKESDSLTRELVYKPKAEEVGISIVLVADTQGSLEAILASFPEDAKVIMKKTGDITEADVLLAKSTGGIVLGFNTRIKPEVVKLSGLEKVLVKNYNVIYEMLDEVADVVEGKKLSMMEQILGTAKIQASFPFNKEIVLGVKILEGRVAKGDKVRIERNEETVGEGKIASLRQGKNQISKLTEGNEAGIIISPSIDFHVGDVVICHS